MSKELKITVCVVTGGPLALPFRVVAAEEIVKAHQLLVRRTAHAGPQLYHAAQRLLAQLPPLWDAMLLACKYQVKPGLLRAFIDETLGRAVMEQQRVEHPSEDIVLTPVTYTVTL